MSQSITAGKLLSLGFTYSVFSGIQIDIVAVLRRLADGALKAASLCDHNCTKEFGGYECPSALTLNKGVTREFAPGPQLLHWVLDGRDGLRLARDRFLQEHFAGYCDAFEVPPDVRGVLVQALRLEVCEV